MLIAPFNLPWGSSIYARIIAKNVVGDSQTSDVGNGAIILTQPDKPIALSDNAAVTSSNQIALTWNEGTDDGGSPVIDYTISYKEQDSIDGYEVKEGVTDTFTTVTGLTQGTTYQIKVQARNLHGLSEFSDEIEVLAAQVPDQPNTPTTTIAAEYVQISWNVPDDRGSALLGYTIYIRKSDGTFDIDVTDCNGATQEILDAASCLVPISTLRASSFQLDWGSSVYVKVAAYNVYGYSF